MTSLFYAGVLGIIFIALSINIIISRRKLKLALGDDNIIIKRKIRAQGNFAEYTPFFLVLLYMIEKNGTSSMIINILGTLFVIARISHAYSLLKAEIYINGQIAANPIWRILGMVMTFTCILIVSLIAIKISLNLG